MFSLRLIIPTAETSPWEYSPNALRSRRFPRLADGTGIVLASVSAPGRVSANPFRCFSPQPHIHSLIRALLGPGGKPSADIWNSFLL